MIPRELHVQDLSLAGAKQQNAEVGTSEGAAGLDALNVGLQPQWDDNRHVLEQSVPTIFIEQAAALHTAARLCMATMQAAEVCSVRLLDPIPFLGESKLSVLQEVRHFKVVYGALPFYGPFLLTNLSKSECRAGSKNGSLYCARHGCILQYAQCRIACDSTIYLTNLPMQVAASSSDVRLKRMMGATESILKAASTHHASLPPAAPVLKEQLADATSTFMVCSLDAFKSYADCTLDEPMSDMLCRSKYKQEQPILFHMYKKSGSSGAVALIWAKYSLQAPSRQTCLKQTGHLQQVGMPVRRAHHS